MLRIGNIKLAVNDSSDKLLYKAGISLGVNPSQIKSFEIVKKSIDARDKDNIYFIYSIDVEIAGEQKYIGKKNVSLAEKTEYKTTLAKNGKLRPIVVGAGPAGLFAALILSEAGLRPIILERGKLVCERKKDVELFWKTGVLNESSNVQFGEGGAGAFSDGKLTTGISDFRIQKVISEFIACGAPEEIKYLAKPHIGTDKLVGVIENLRKKIEALGGEFRFNTVLTGIKTEKGSIKGIITENNLTGFNDEIECDKCVLALGHSARDTFEMLYNEGVYMEAKAFSMGVRIEHKQKEINKAQYGKYWDNEKLGSADYKLNCNVSGRGVYTFCMCPGGRVIGASSEVGRLAVNGMSYHSRDLENANSALLVSINPSDFSGNHPLRAISFQREVEAKAYKLGGSNYYAPVQLTGDFIKGCASRRIGDVVPSYEPGYTLTDLSECLPDFMNNALKTAIITMGKKIQGFDKYDSVLTAVESRSSSPVRIVRDKIFNSNISGLIPCGEGAGYAGGIMSACVDGIKCAESVIR